MTQQEYNPQDILPCALRNSYPHLDEMMIQVLCQSHKDGTLKNHLENWQPTPEPSKDLQILKSITIEPEEKSIV